MDSIPPDAFRALRKGDYVVTDIFKSADWAREAEQKKRAPDFTDARHRGHAKWLPDTPVYMDENGDLWTITYLSNERVRLFGGPAGGSMRDGSE